MAFKLLKDRFDHKAGTIVYAHKHYDYGLKADDENATGIPHATVTLRPDGYYPFFTVPKTDLVAYTPTKEDAWEMNPSDEHVKSVCKPGKSEKTCRYLGMSAGGWCCFKHTDDASTLDLRAKQGHMSARGDNCEGFPRPPKK